MNQKLKALAAGVAFGFVLSGVTVALVVKRPSAPDRFEIRETKFLLAGKTARALKVNIQTGESWGLTENGWVLIPNSN